LIGTHLRNAWHHGLVGRVADRFVVGRVALIGDAAHLSPPWIGQGLNAGLRDVGNLAWKLAGIVTRRLSPSVLASYERERRDHARAMIDLADLFGALLMPTSRVKAGLRDAVMGAVRWFPGVRDYLLQMRFKPMPTYRDGLVMCPGTSKTVGGKEANWVITVTAPDGTCTWTATSDVSWLVVRLTTPTAMPVAGSGTVKVRAVTNDTGAARTGHLTINGVVYTVKQLVG